MPPTPAAHRPALAVQPVPRHPGDRHHRRHRNFFPSPSHQRRVPQQPISMLLPESIKALTTTTPIIMKIRQPRRCSPSCRRATPTSRMPRQFRPADLLCPPCGPPQALLPTATPTSHTPRQLQSVNVLCRFYGPPQALPPPSTTPLPRRFNALTTPIIVKVHLFLADCPTRTLPPSSRTSCRAVPPPTPTRRSFPSRPKRDENEQTSQKSSCS